MVFDREQSDKDLLENIFRKYDEEKDALANRATVPAEEPSSEPEPEPLSGEPAPESAESEQDSVVLQAQGPGVEIPVDPIMEVAVQAASTTPPDPGHSELFRDAIAAADAAPAPEPVVPQAEPAPAPDGSVVNLGGTATVGVKKASHGRLILDGTCSRCAHCGMKLTDAVSVERGLGPVCSQKGYEDVVPQDTDDMHALILLSEWPELVEHLTENYKPKGLRGLMNGLVRVCSLNRRSPVHKACTDAIEALGYVKLAAALRESLAVVKISKSEVEEGAIEIWIRKDVYVTARGYGSELRQIFGQRWNPARRRPIVPLTKKVPDPETGGTKDARILTYVYNRDERGNRTSKRIYWAPDLPGDQKAMSNKALLWHLLCRHFEGFIVKTEDKGGVYIKPAKA